jgi:hypothetical protein
MIDPIARRSLSLLVLMVVIGCAVPARGQITPVPIFPTTTPGGVYIDPEGTLTHKQVDQGGEVANQRLRAKAMNQPPKHQAMTYVSLAKLQERLKELAEQKKEIPDDLKYLSGLTAVRYVFVFPDEHDIVIAGPSEEINASNKLTPVGKQTGRPVLHLDDLFVSLRLLANPQVKRMGAFGCSIDPTPQALEKSSAVMQEYANAGRAARMKAMAEALGPQRVSVFGMGGAEETRVAFVTLAADYRLKRMCLGVDPVPVAGVGSAVDNSRAAGNRFWFEANYTPLLVSQSGDAYEVRGQRLMLKAGELQFDEKGATETAKAFAKRFTEKFAVLATVVPEFADLQNVADLALVATLIRKDGLERKAGVDLSWLISPGGYAVQKIPTAKQAKTLVNYTSGSIVAGGVSLNLGPVLDEASREKDAKGTMEFNKARPREGWAFTKGRE